MSFSASTAMNQAAITLCYPRDFLLFQVNIFLRLRNPGQIYGNPLDQGLPYELNPTTAFIEYLKAQ
ncbi:uncharacterized protein N7473_011986 [Penicillium subrubescens]|uniref:uncharacterized protein n=1 Tax=Penicillium subrubescens TaxID=1316194 RepID=UPI0025453C4C|nr:uncharacterized protein N7473_011986 [Penicillium subrubescens]KAJ5880933.1 hypothetical protein N7473_011986 [Penicillium subrubescens]